MLFFWRLLVPYLADFLYFDGSDSGLSPLLASRLLILLILDQESILCRSVHFTDQKILLEQADQNSICDPVAIETETIGARIRFAVVFDLHAIVGSGGIRYSSAEGLRENRAISCLYTALCVHIKLREWDELADGYFLALVILEWNLLGLVPTGPDDEVSLVDVASLFLVRRRLDKFDSLFGSVDDALVEVLGVAAQTGVRVEVAVLAGEDLLVELRVAVLLGLGHSWIKYSDLVSVEDLDAAGLEVLGQLGVVELPVFVLEVAEALADAPAGHFLVLTDAAVFAIRNRF